MLSDQTLASQSELWAGAEFASSSSYYASETPRKRSVALEALTPSNFPSRKVRAIAGPQQEAYDREREARAALQLELASVIQERKSLLSENEHLKQLLSEIAKGRERQIESIRDDLGVCMINVGLLGQENAALRQQILHGKEENTQETNFLRNDVAELFRIAREGTNTIQRQDHLLMELDRAIQPNSALTFRNLILFSFVTLIGVFARI
ncbi:hypothetical protein VNI00_013872 [Paramarasmius palmivorus]|uniref:Uncharacterized protein n=1 Tax=Paramarasmius palmivorus TaxID=297713 RepID=A0AAW0BXU4_9AGAR